MEIEIKKAKLSKGGAVEATYIDADGNEITLKGKHKCHNDLRTAFARLSPYFADLTEQKESDRIDWDDLESAGNVDLLRKISVSGISIGGDSNNRIITMSGSRTLFTSRVLNLNAPGIEMDSETFEWNHIDEFDVAIEDVVYEVKEYIVNRKWEVVQQDINFDANPDDPFADAEATQDAPPIGISVDNVA